jgi:ubiquinone/menaquinone biosynthesis C-methylase UbiE
LISSIIENLLAFFPSFKRVLWHWWYQKLAKYSSLDEFRFMNYGYTTIDVEDKDPDLKEEDEINRSYIQLYHHVSSYADFKEKDVLEVGSGRGGGADYLARYLSPKKYTGIDFSKNVINKCKEYFNLNNLIFEHGNALKIPFEKEKFDIVINVESSHCYEDFDKFIEEVSRVLKDNGYFLWADFREPDQFPEIFDQFREAGFDVIEMNDISRNVIRALDSTTKVKTKLIKKYVPRWLKKTFKDFAGIQDTKVYSAFKKQTLKYKSVCLQKRLILN